MKNQKNVVKKLRFQAGFTLPEILMVVAMLGIVIGIVARSLGGSTDGGNATALLRTSQKLTDNWSIIAQTCGTTTDVSSSPVSGSSASNALMLLMGGNVAAASGGYEVTANYEACYLQSKVLPLTDSAQWDSTNTKWRVVGFAPTLSWDNSTGQAALEVEYEDVPDAIALKVVQTYIPSLKTLSDTADASNPTVHYGAKTATGARTVAIRRPVN